MHAFTATPQVAADPAMPATVLAEIARDRPELRPYLAAHPAACRQRLGWLVVLGGPRSTPSCGRGAADGPRRPQRRELPRSGRHGDHCRSWGSGRRSGRRPGGCSDCAARPPWRAER